MSNVFTFLLFLYARCISSIGQIVKTLKSVCASVLATPLDVYPHPRGCVYPKDQDTPGRPFACTIISRMRYVYTEYFYGVVYFSTDFARFEVSFDGKICMKFDHFILTQDY